MKHQMLYLLFILILKFILISKLARLAIMEMAKEIFPCL